MKNISLMLMDLDNVFLSMDYQKQVIRFCIDNHLQYGFITSRDYKSCLYPVNLMNLYTPVFLFSHSGNGLHVKSYSSHNYNPYMNYNPYRVDDNYSNLLNNDWPGTDVIINLLKELDDCELVSSSQFYLTYYIPDIFTLNVVEYILSTFNVRMSYSSKLFLEIFPANGGLCGCLNYLTDILEIPYQSFVIASSALKLEETEKYPCKRIITSPCYKAETFMNTPGSNNYFAAYPGSQGVYEGLCFFLKKNSIGSFSKVPG